MPVRVPPIPFIGRRKRRRSPAAAPAVPPVLVSASYDPGGPSLTLTFDRAVDIGAGGGGFDGTQVVVDDPVTAAARFDGTGGATVAGPETVEVALVNVDLPSGTTVTLTATGETGIVSAPPVGGAPWAGATDLALPFP